MKTLQDIQLATGTAISSQLVNDVAADTPLLAALPCEVIKGTSIITRRVTSIPKIGPNPLGAGVPVNRSHFEQKRAECHHFGGMIEVQKALAEADPRGKGFLMQEEAVLSTKGALFTIEQHAIYGNAMDADGMPGIYDGIGDYMTISADPAKNSDTAREHGGASVLALRLKPEAVSLLFGNAKALNFEPVEKVTTPCLTHDGKPGKMTVYQQELSVWCGVSVKSEFAVGRLVNESASKPLTDELLAELVALFPAAFKPTHLVMNRKTLSRLQKSRAASLTYQKKTSGSTTYAELPKDYEGIPIIVTDALLDDETPANIAAAGAVDAISIAKSGTISR